jgi:hypothetical protein
MAIYYYTLQYQTYLNKQNNQYEDIITLNTFPRGPLQKLIRKIRLPILSPFEVEPYSSCNNRCCYAIMSRYNFMHDCELPDLLSFLSNNGYSIKTDITNMFNQNQHTNNSIICYISYITQ